MPDISVIIPTYGREEVLLDSIAAVLAQRPAELIVVDQTGQHRPEVSSQLDRWDSQGDIRWLRVAPPSIPRAMNRGLREAENELVLFLDDDIVPGTHLLNAHYLAHQQFPDAWAIVGRVLQPGETSGPAPRNGWTREGLSADMGFPFWSDQPEWVSNVMAGNLSVKRGPAIGCGGFDEHFTGAAYRFETEFARRVIRQGGRIRFEPRASIRHLRAESGGTRAKGNHLASASPRHGIGDYYFALRQGITRETVWYMARRPWREVATRFHLRRPWFIPVKLIGECRALVGALRLVRRPPKLIGWDESVGGAEELTATLNAAERTT